VLETYAEEFLDCPENELVCDEAVRLETSAAMKIY